MVYQNPRLVACFPTSQKEIIDSVENESPGARMVIMAHYSSLPFVSKPATYWERPFAENYVQFCMMIGIRNVADDLTILADLKSCILEEFSIHNEESIKTAIKMNLRSDFGEVIEAYGQFNRIYLTKIMVNYQKKLLKDHKKAIEIRNKLSEPVELTDDEKKQKLIESIQSVFIEFKQQNHDSIDLISHAIYDYLDSVKKIQLTPGEKNGLMNEAKIYLSMLPNNKYKMSDMGLDDKSRNELVAISKRIAVKNYFKQTQALDI